MHKQTSLFAFLFVCAGVWKDDPQFLEFVHKSNDKQQLREDFTKLFESDRKANFADVKFVVEGKEVYAHKV